MAQISYNPENVPQIPGAKIALIMSKWYLEYSESMAKKCLEVLELSGCDTPEQHILPGALELPLAARRLIKRSPDLEAIIAFGVIVKGDTYHFDMVKDLCFSGFERVMFEEDIPLINEVLPVADIKDAEARAADDEKNKGIEAGLAAAEIISWRRAHPIMA